MIENIGQLAGPLDQAGELVQPSQLLIGVVTMTFILVVYFAGVVLRHVVFPGKAPKLRQRLGFGVLGFFGVCSAMGKLIQTTMASVWNRHTDEFDIWLLCGVVLLVLEQGMLVDELLRRWLNPA